MKHMAIELNAVTDSRIYLPSSFEFDERLDSILNLALDRGADETSVIGPWILYEATDESKALEAVKEVLQELGIE